MQNLIQRLSKCVEDNNSTDPVMASLTFPAAFAQRLNSDFEPLTYEVIFPNVIHLFVVWNSFFFGILPYFQCAS